MPLRTEEVPMHEDLTDEGLWRAHLEAPSEETLEALVTRYEPLARYLAKKALAKAPPWQDREDILSFAHHGLLDAIRLFDANKGAKFETYATQRISGAIIDHQRRMDPLTRNQRKAVKDLEAALAELEGELSRTPTEHELAERLGISVDDVRGAYYDRQSLPGSLEEQLENAEGRATNTEVGYSPLQAHADSEAEVVSQLVEAREHLSRRIARLPRWQRSLLIWHYCENMSLKDLSRLLALTEPRCSQLRAETLRQLIIP